MSFSPLISQLIEALRCLPGVGPKTAQRMALQLLDRERDQALHLAEILKTAVNEVGRCRQCRTLSEQILCAICDNQKREVSQLCIVETPIDLMAIEQSSSYRGLYFVLMGRLSPLDGIGPAELQ